MNSNLVQLTFALVGLIHQPFIQMSARNNTTAMLNSMMHRIRLNRHPASQDNNSSTDVSEISGSSTIHSLELPTGGNAGGSGLRRSSLLQSNNMNLNMNVDDGGGALSGNGCLQLGLGSVVRRDRSRSKTRIQ